jgi:hypothetical protein
MPYYVSIQGQTYGPAEADELKQWHRAGTFGPSDFVWDDASNSWIEAARVPGLETVFQLPPTPATGVEDIEELPRPEAARSTIDAAAEPEATAYCANHEMDASTGICPRCQRALCDRCLLSVDGLRVCVDCVGEQKGAASAGWKRTAVLVAAFGSIPVIMLGAYIFFASTPAPQSDTPEKIDLALGDAPAIVSEFLTPAERQKAEDAMKTIFQALGGSGDAAPNAGSDTTAGAAHSLEALVASGRLAALPAPPRDGFEFRIAEDGKAVTLWSAGESGRALLSYDRDGLKDLPKE